MNSPVSRRALSMLSLVLACGATIAVADVALQRVCPLLPKLIEVNDGVAAYEAGDPDTLVLGSSHSRSFAAIRDELARRTNGEHAMSLVAVEWGKLTSYEWVLNHRLRPLIEAEDGSGHLVRPSLSRVLLVTEWWDGCAPEGGKAFNLPAKAWELKDFLADVAESGVTEFNRNYVTTRWKELTSGSILVQDRGLGRLQRALRGLLKSEEGRRVMEKSDYDTQVAIWRQMIEGAYDDPMCTDPGERAALGRILDYFAGRKVEVTLVLFPRMPVTLTDRARETTIRRFAVEMQVLTRARGLRLVDLTYGTPLGDSDFMSDFDHVTAEGNAKLATWALAGPLSDLLGPPKTARAP